MSKKQINILMVIVACIFLFSAGKILVTLVQQHREKKEFDDLAAQVEAQIQSDADTQGNVSENGNADGDNTGAGNTDSASNGERPVMDVDPETGMLKPYEVLYEQNHDLFGWIKIEDTGINYPVMCTPDDMEYYLKRAFSGVDANGGTPFLDTACTEEGHMYIIYGHHMQNKTMFGTLPYYAEKEYWEAHPLIYFDTLYEQGTYEVVAAFYSKVYSADEEGFRYYAYKDLSDEQVFEEFLDGVSRSRLYDTGVSMEYGDTVLLLSTCSYHTDDGRFVVVAVKRED